MKHFRRVTRGHAVVAGRKTYETFQTRPLPQRRNFVLTRNPAYAVAEGVGCMREAWPRFCSAPRVHGSEKLFVLGGAQIYALALPLADEMILTHLPIEVEGDAYFPAWGRKRMGGDRKAMRRRAGLCDVSPLLRRCIKTRLWV